MLQFTPKKLMLIDLIQIIKVNLKAIALRIEPNVID